MTQVKVPGSIALCTQRYYTSKRFEVTRGGKQKNMRRTMHTENENPIVKRITEELIRQGKTQKALTEYIGGTQGMYSDWKSGRVKSYERYIGKIAEFLNVSEEYLLLGHNNDPDEMKLIEIYRTLDAEQKKKILEYASEIIR